MHNQNLNTYSIQSFDLNSVTKDQSLTLILQDLAGLSHVLDPHKKNG